MTKEKVKKIGIRRYVNLALFLIAVILLCLIVRKLYNLYQTNKLENSVLSRVVGTIQYDDIQNAKSELVSDDFIFISYTKSEEVRKLENKLKNIIISNNLQNNFYYLNATDLMLEDDYIKTLNENFSLKDKFKIINIPALLYYKNGELIKTISSSENSIMSSDEFSKILDSYEIIERD